jgi:cyclohexanone monooxygenase
MTDVQDYDAIVVGSGFAGLYQLHRLRGMGLSARVLERGDGVGGTWYWNRYPGARCDSESMHYSFSFSRELEQEWEWTERYPTQPEILRYMNHVADRFDLRRDIQFETTVTSAHYDDDAHRWTIGTDTGETFSARFLIMATGCLSTAKMPDFPGLDSFRGDWYHTGAWPHTGADFTGKKVAVIGTGSTAIQAIPRIAQQAAHLTVFQRTANFSMPANNHPLDPAYQREMKAHYPEHRQAARESAFGIPFPPNDRKAFDDDEAGRRAEYQRRWDAGGASVLAAYADLLSDEQANETAAEFVREKIRGIVKDPATAELLAPRDHPLGTKRICVDTGYFETYNRDNVSLVSVREHPIEAITETGLRTTDAEYEFDAIVFAIGFDAMTGALLNIDVRGRDGRSLRDDWADGPRAYLGLQIAGYPNLFTITGPGSPSVLSNMTVSIEQHVEFISDLLAKMQAEGVETVEADAAAQDAWVQHVADMANATLFPRANSWYVGANVPGKPRVFSPYIGGVGNYRKQCDEIAANGYEGFVMRAAEAAAA